MESESEQAEPGFADRVRRAPQAAVVAEKDLQRIGGVPGQRVLVTRPPGRSCRWWSWWCCARRSPWPGCTATSRWRRPTAACPAGGNRGQREVVIAVGDGRRSLEGAGFKRGCVPLLSKGDGGVGAGAAAESALVLPQALILIVAIDRPGKGVAGGDSRQARRERWGRPR